MTAANEGQIHQISAEIGALKKAVELMTDMWKAQETTASAGRKSLHDKFELLRGEVGLQVSGLSLRMDRLTDKVTLIEPYANGFREDKLRDEGAKRLGVKLYAALVAGATLLGWAAHEFINWARHV